MCNFNSLNDEVKLNYHKQLITISDSFGGINFFLQFLEAIRKDKNHPLTARDSYFNSSFGSIKWNKVIFKDKITLLLKIRFDKNDENNILPKKNNREYKKILNLVRTLKPILFTIKPYIPENEEDKLFIIKPFDIIGEDKTVLNPIFEIIFFCSIDKVKKILSYK